MSPEYRRFEHTLAWHCAPALAGIKPADLVSWAPPEGEWPRLLGHYVRALYRRGIRLQVLGRRGGRMLLLVFRPGRLERCLAQPRVRSMLDRAGYPAGDAAALLRHLRGRMDQAPFPHEVGLFLGYPAEDVEGFVRCGGRECKLSGCWKVYGDVEQARQRFDAFLRCRRGLTRRVELGHSLEQVFPPQGDKRYKK